MKFIVFQCLFVTIIALFIFIQGVCSFDAANRGNIIYSVLQDYENIDIHAGNMVRTNGQSMRFVHVFIEKTLVGDPTSGGSSI